MAPADPPPPTATSAHRAIPELLDRHGGKIYALGLRLCGDSEDAQDLVQETFLAAFRKWEQFEGRADPSTWLYTIASRACRRFHRRRSGEPRRMEPLTALLPGREEAVPDLAPRPPSPLDDQLRREARETVEAALAELPLPFRLPLVLKDIAELSNAQVAQVLGIREATVKTRVHRARMRLRQALANELPRRPAPPPTHGRLVCLDLLQAKQEALDRGVEFPVPQAELCSRCEALFSTLDLGREVCAGLGHGELPGPVRELVLRRLRDPPK